MSSISSILQPAKHVTLLMRHHAIESKIIRRFFLYHVGTVFASRLWQFICLPVWLVASGFLPVSVQLGWWCPGLRLSPIHLFPLVAMHLSPSLASGNRLLGCLQFICLPLWQLICFPIWLVVSGLSAVSNSLVSPYTVKNVNPSTPRVYPNPRFHVKHYARRKHLLWLRLRSYLAHCNVK